MNELQIFIEYLTNEKRFSVHTIRAYRDDIGSFYSFMAEHSNHSAIEAIPEDVRAWLLGFASQQLSPRTYKRKLSSLKAFYKFMLREGLVSRNPAETVLSPKLRNPLPDFFSNKEVTNLFDFVIFPDSFEGHRDKLVLSTFYFTGIRLSELVRLQIRDIDLSLNKLRC